MPKPSVIDAHIHFWDPERMDYAWLDAVRTLRRAFRPEDIRPGSVCIDGMVFVEADRRQSESLAEVDWALSLSSPARPVVGIVAAALDSPSADVTLEALGRNGYVKGVRRLLQNMRPGLCLEPAFVGAVQSLARRGLVFDLCVRHQQLAEATALVAQCPEVTFVLDHLGKPRVRPFPDRRWLVDIERLAALPNSRCKLSGLTSEVLDPIGFGDHRSLFRPYLDHALQTFGPSRCMFGSDWPVASLTVTYEGWFDHVMETLTAFSATEVDRVLGQTATEVYRLASTRYPNGCSDHDDANLPLRPDRERGGEQTWH
jgi:L-fuconolactonase